LAFPSKNIVVFIKRRFLAHWSFALLANPIQVFYLSQFVHFFFIIVVFYFYYCLLLLFFFAHLLLFVVVISLFLICFYYLLFLFCVH